MQIFRVWKTGEDELILTKNNIDMIDIDLLVNDKIKQGLLNEILFIVPTRRKIRYYTRELISLSPHGVVSGLKIETIGSYCLKLLANSGLESNPVTDEASVILLSHCFKETKLKYFSQYKEEIPFGTLERIKNVISEYKRHGITPGKLKEESGKLDGTEREKARDITQVYDLYNKKLKDLYLNEIGDVYSILLSMGKKEFINEFKETYPDVKLVVINGFDEFTSPETEIINFTAEAAQIELFIVLDYYKYNPAVFSHLNACHDRFTERGFKEIEDISFTEQKKFISYVREKLSIKDPGKKDIFQKEILIQITAQNREDEIELIAKEIKELILEENVEPGKICVVFNLIGKYSPVIRDRFTVYGIPFNLTDRFSLNTSAPVKAIIHFLEIIETDFYNKNIFRAFSSHFINVERIDIANLLKASVELNVISGYENWKNRIADVKKKFLNGEDDPEMSKKVLFELIQAEKDIDKIHSMLKPFSTKQSPGEFYKNIRSLLNKINTAERILNADDEIIENDIKALTTFIEGLNELTIILEREYGRESIFYLQFYLSQLKTLAAFTRFNVKEKPGYGVQVTTLNEIRGLKFDYLFIAGLSDGDIPTKYSPEIFFSGSFMKNEERHQTEERYLFYQALCAWKKRLYLSYPQFDEKKELVQSSFLLDFKKLFEVVSRDRKNYKDKLYSIEELLKQFGKINDKDLSELHLSEKLKNNLNKIKEDINIDKIRRENPFGEYEYTGYLGNGLTEELKQRLDEISQKEFSITQLETYAKCPYKYFAERILKLETIEEPTEELEAFELGSLVHTILYEFFTELKKQEIVIAKCSDNDFRTAEKLLFKIAEEKFDALNLSSDVTFYEREKLFGIGDNYKDSILYQFLEEERKDEEGYTPSFFETEFGKDAGKRKETKLAGKEIKAGDVKLRGKIDRIDINYNHNVFKVIDYKLGGNKPSADDISAGISLQLPLYLFAAKELIKAQLDKDYKPSSAEIFSLKYTREDFGKNSVSHKIRKSKHEPLEEHVRLTEEMINISVDMINKFVKDIAEGKFHLTTLQNRENKVCRFCELKKICRIQEVS